VTLLFFGAPLHHFSAKTETEHRIRQLKRALIRKALEIEILKNIERE
jgi:hypothetical protein